MNTYSGKRIIYVMYLLFLAIRSKRLSHCLVNLAILAAMVFAGGKVFAADGLSLSIKPGWQFQGWGTGSGQYRYGPSSIINADGSIDMWLASPAWPPASVDPLYQSYFADYIRYRRSTDGGHTWSEYHPNALEFIVLRPTPDGEDRLAVCDPGVVKIGSYYYLGYTGLSRDAGTPAHVFVSRSQNPNGPYVKWNGSGWGGAPESYGGMPQPMIRWTGSETSWGYGEPSFVLKDNKLYIYYTEWAGTPFKTNLAICDNPYADDWPAHLRIIGTVIVHVNDFEDSADVKWCPASNSFIAVATNTRFNIGSDISIWQSTDGQSNWQRVQRYGIKLQDKASNIGLSGNASGHLITSQSNFVCYATGDPYTADWNTYLNPVTIEQIAVVSPNGGESFFVGQKVTILWTTTISFSNARIEYSADGGGTWNTVIANTPNSGSYVWTVPNVVSNNCLVRVSDAANSSFVDTSDTAFTIYSCDLTADLNNDCRVDWQDLEILISNWLK